MDLTDDCFHDANKAREYFEAQRWPFGPVCPHCGNANQDKITGLQGKAHRAGLYQCADCREQFTVTVGSVMERSKIPLNKWLLAIHLMGASKKGMSAHQLHRTLKITYQSAWFLCHRIREAMRDEAQGPMGGNGKIVEADETYFGRVATPRTRTTSGRAFIKAGKAANKRPILALVERGGSVRTFHVPVADKESVTKIVRENIARESSLHTDESKLYTGSNLHFAAHATVLHTAKEYTRFEQGVAIHTNSAEGYFSIFKRGMRGVYQHCKEKHLHRYLAEFDFRYNNRARLGVDDTARASRIVKGAEGKRLTYRRPHSARSTGPAGATLA
jgi:transposase-like protein